MAEKKRKREDDKDPAYKPKKSDMLARFREACKPKREDWSIICDVVRRGKGYACTEITVVGQAMAYPGFVEDVYLKPYDPLILDVDIPFRELKKELAKIIAAHAMPHMTGVFMYHLPMPGTLRQVVYFSKSEEAIAKYREARSGSYIDGDWTTKPWVDEVELTDYTMFSNNPQKSYEWFWERA